MIFYRAGNLECTVYTLSSRINCESNTLYFLLQRLLKPCKKPLCKVYLCKQSETESDSMKMKTDLFQWNMRWWIEFSFNEKDIPTKDSSEKKVFISIENWKNCEKGKWNEETQNADILAGIDLILLKYYLLSWRFSTANG